MIQKMKLRKLDCCRCKGIIHRGDVIFRDIAGQRKRSYCPHCLRFNIWEGLRKRWKKEGLRNIRSEPNEKDEKWIIRIINDYYQKVVII